MDTKRIAIVGCGLIGRKRMLSMPKEDRIIWFIDKDLDKAKILRDEYASITGNIEWYADDYTQCEKDPLIDIVIVATPNNMLYEISLKAVNAGKHVLIEKPGAINYNDLEHIYDTCAKSKEHIVAQVGYNLRYHPAMRKARTMIFRGDIGRIFRIQGYYGHGGRLGYEKEWRANPAISGGGVLLDLGSHLINLAYFFTECDFPSFRGDLENLFWQMPLEDTATVEMKSKNSHISANFAVSCAEWKNTFSYEIYGEKGKLHIQGLGGSYGTETLAWNKMSPKMGIPETTTWEFCGEDKSWLREWRDFLYEINYPAGEVLATGLETLKIINQIYSEM